MLTSTFEHDLIRKYTVVFGALFNDISINRKDAAGDNEQKLKVRLSYGPKDKWLARINQNPSGGHDDRPAITLPHMAFELAGGLEYDPSRKVGTLRKISGFTADDNAKASVYTPVPYNIPYQLYIISKNTTDGQRIVEQILPYFRPQYTITTEVLESLGISHDIAVVLNSVNLQDTYEGDYAERRYIVWTLSFTVKGFFYGPITNSGIIKFVEANIYTSMTAIEPSVEITVQPGLLANGSPTTDPSQTIPYANVNYEDDWAYIVQIDEDY